MWRAGISHQKQDSVGRGEGSAMFEKIPIKAVGQRGPGSQASGSVGTGGYGSFGLRISRATQIKISSLGCRYSSSWASESLSSRVISPRAENSQGHRPWLLACASLYTHVPRAKAKWDGSRPPGCPGSRSELVLSQGPTEPEGAQT